MPKSNLNAQTIRTCDDISDIPNVLKVHIHVHIVDRESIKLCDNKSSSIAMVREVRKTVGAGLVKVTVWLDSLSRPIEKS